MLRPSLLVPVALLSVFAACGSDSSGADAAAGNGVDGPAGTGGSGGTGGTGGGSGTGGAAGTGGAGGAGGMASLGCGVGSGSSSCNQTELDTYNTCSYSACESQFKACYGAGVQMGNFSGPCGVFISCTSKCGCSDLACFRACGFPSADCQRCSLDLETCRNNSSCARPACLRTADGGGLPSFDGGYNFPDVTLPDVRFDSTCADLMSCCTAIANADKKAQCQSQYTASAGNDLVCGVLYAQFKGAGDCP